MTTVYHPQTSGRGDLSGSKRCVLNSSDAVSALSGFSIRLYGEKARQGRSAGIHNGLRESIQEIQKSNRGKMMRTCLIMEKIFNVSL